jgi:hypothetical protein
MEYYSHDRFSLKRLCARRHSGDSRMRPLHFPTTQLDRSLEPVDFTDKAFERAPTGALCSVGWTGASRPLRIKWDVR